MTNTPLPPLDRWQYRLTAAPHDGARAVDGFYLSVGPGLPCAEVFDAAGTRRGVLLGFALDLPRAAIVGERWAAPADLATDDGVHLALRALGGRYVLILTGADRPRVYPDVVTGVSCVWDAKAQSVGATAGAILSDADYAARFDQALFDQLQIRGEGWLPAGLTAHHGINRLLANHYLDLQSWTAQRFEAVAPRTPTPDEVMDGVIDTVRLQTRALMSGPRKVAVALTAGRDSRAILACLHDMTDELTFTTVTGSDRHQTDSIISRQLTGDLGLTHKILPRQEADAAAQERLIKRGGHCYADSNTRFHPSVAPLYDDYVFLGGLGGEIARAFYWSDSDDPAMPVTSALLMKRFGLRPSDKVETAIQVWLDALPTIGNARAILDLAYIELRLGPWAMAQFCTDPTLQRYSPMITYDAVRLLLDLQDDWKTGDRLNEAIVARMWPVLNNYPYNTLGPWRDSWIKLQRVIENPRLIVKKLRQKRG